MATAITHEDLGYMRNFPPQKKMGVIHEIMSKSPVKEWNLEGNNNYVKTILRLRAGGLMLIDLQPLETAFTSVWYKKNGSLLKREKSEIAALVVWEFNSDDKDLTTIRVWDI